MPRGRPKGSKDKTPRKSRGKATAKVVDAKEPTCCGDCNGTCTTPAAK